MKSSEDIFYTNQAQIKSLEIDRSVIDMLLGLFDIEDDKINSFPAITLRKDYNYSITKDNFENDIQFIKNDLTRIDSEIERLEKEAELLKMFL